MDYEPNRNAGKVGHDIKTKICNQSLIEPNLFLLILVESSGSYQWLSNEA